MGNDCSGGETMMKRALLLTLLLFVSASAQDSATPNRWKAPKSDHFRAPKSNHFRAPNLGLRVGDFGGAGAGGSAAQAYSATGNCPTTGRTWTAEGFGASTQGGCQSGQTVLVVDTLNDVDDSGATTASGLNSNKGTDGLISLREASGVSGVRLVRFAVSGYIDLNSEIEVLNGSVTFDGGDAPNKGVCVRRDAFRIRVGEVIVRYMRFRRGFEVDATGGDVDSFSLTGSGSYSDNILVDHCSMSYGDDGNFDINSHIRNATVQWTLFYHAGGTGNMLIATGSDTCNSNTGPTQISVHHCLSAGTGSRSPEQNTGDLSWVNNVIYRNFDGTDFYGPGDHLKFTNLTVIGSFDLPVIRSNFVKNYYKAGQDEEVSINSAAGQIKMFESPDCPGTVATAYFEDNWGIDNEAGTPGVVTGANIAEVDAVGTAVAGSPYAWPAITTTSAAQAYTDVLAQSGARLPCLDESDIGILNDVSTGTGSNPADPTSGEFTPPYGGWPDLTVPCAAQGGGTPSSTKGRLGTKGRAKLQ